MSFALLAIVGSFAGMPVVGGLPVWVPAEYGSGSIAGYGNGVGVEPRYSSSSPVAGKPVAVGQVVQVVDTREHRQEVRRRGACRPDRPGRRPGSPEDRRSGPGCRVVPYHRALYEPSPATPPANVFDEREGARARCGLVLVVRAALELVLPAMGREERSDRRAGANRRTGEVRVNTRGLRVHIRVPQQRNRVGADRLRARRKDLNAHVAESTTVVGVTELNLSSKRTTQVHRTLTERRTEVDVRRSGAALVERRCCWRTTDLRRPGTMPRRPSPRGTRREGEW